MLPSRGCRSRSGCGAFGNEPPLRLVYKWVRMVAEFRDKGKAGEFVGVVYEFLANITMAELYLPDEAMTAEGPTG